MTNTEQSRLWADDVVRSLESAYQTYHYWTLVNEMIKPLNDFQVLVRYKYTKGMIREKMQKELDNFLNDHIKEAAGEAPKSPGNR